MNTGMIPVRYAKALLEFALENSASESVYAEMGTLADRFAQEPDLGRALDNPVLPPQRKTELIRLAAGGDVSDVFDRFIGLVMRNKREKFLHPISLTYLDLYRKLHRIRIGRLETAVAVTPQTEERIRTLIERRTRGKVELATRVKPELIGGFVFEMDSRRMDASIATQLRSIKRQFIEKNRRIV